MWNFLDRQNFNFSREKLKIFNLLSKIKSSKLPILKFRIPLRVGFVNPISSASSSSRNLVAEMWIIKPLSLLDIQDEKHVRYKNKEKIVEGENID